MIFSRRFYANENPSRFHCQESTLYPEHNNPSSYAGLSLHESSTKVQVEQTPMFKNGQTFYLPYKCAVNILEFIPFTTYLSAAVDMLFIRELKMETFSGRRRPDWQRKPRTKAAVAPRQK